MKELKNCIVCSGPLSKVCYLGHLYPSKFVEKPEDKAKYETIETFINWCDKCKNMQSPYVDDGENLFRDYYYNSGINASMRASLLDIVQSKPVQDAYLLEDEKFSWLDIACNDGTMCQQIKDEYGCFVVGVDPAKVNHKGSDVFINDFFSAKIVKDKLTELHSKHYVSSDDLEIKFNVISCIAMMYDIEKIHDFVEDVKSLLKSDGVFVVQLMDLESRLKTYALDDVCFEHVVCYSLYCLRNLFKQHGLEIFDCEYNKTNCSSLRVYVGHAGGHEVRENVEQMILFQSEHLTASHMLAWEEKLGRKLKTFTDYLRMLKANGKDLYLVGASTKASTLLQVCGIDNKLVTAALERSAFKYGRFMMESGIPIISEEEFLSSRFDPKNTTFVLAIWAFRDNIAKAYDKYIKLGAELVVPLPTAVRLNEYGEFKI